MSKKKAEQHYDPDQEGAQPAEAEMLTALSHDELVEKLNEADTKVNDYWERILRMQADAKNVAMRHERDVANAHKYALEKFLPELLPIIDSLELCANSVPEDMRQAAQSVIDGVDLTLKMFHAALDKAGVKQVFPIGEHFDPEYQQAIKMEEDPEAAPGTVISVMQKGYTLNNRLIRPALVVVAKGKE